MRTSERTAGSSRPPIGSEPASSPTRRQLEVLRLRAMGRTIDEVAATLGSSRNTVTNQIGAAYAALNVSCLPDALRVLGWLRVPPA
jgi:DNA-binding NarL/FixJ family response regulator